MTSSTSYRCARQKGKRGAWGGPLQLRLVPEVKVRGLDLSLGWAVMVDIDIGQRRHAAWTLAARLLAFATVGLALWVGMITARRAGDAVYRFDAIDGAALSVAIGVVLYGAFLLVRTSRPEVALLAVAAATLASLGVLALFSVGLVALAVALIPGVAVLRRVQRAPSGTAQPIASGMLIAVGLAAMVLTVPFAPAVECLDGGVATASRWWDSSGGGAATMAPDGSASGIVRFDGESYAYQCHGSDLAEFRRIG